ncbi:unnamed protein product, partial [marine sediment metagenome]
FNSPIHLINYLYNIIGKHSNLWTLSWWPYGRTGGRRESSIHNQ